MVTSMSQMKHSKAPKKICVLLCSPIKINPPVNNRRRPRSIKSKKKLSSVSIEKGKKKKKKKVKKN